MKCVWEHNGDDTLLYSVECVGAYTRGSSLAAAMAKMSDEILSYTSWAGEDRIQTTDIEIVQERNSALQIKDADSDVLFDSEKTPLSPEEYEKMKAFVLKSANDFYTLYNSISDKHYSCLPQRRTFYGNVPRSAQEMYEHTKNVNSYYFAEIGIDVDNEGSIYDCRKRGVDRLEQSTGFLDNKVVEGSYGELWSLRKVMRRFLWHDRIHAKAMYRMALKTFGASGVTNTFSFNVD